MLKILFTGASSFSGFWFIRELVRRGHQVTALFFRQPKEYVGIRKKRVEHITSLCRTIFSCPYSSPHFFSVVSSGLWDLFCHHAADVTDYKSPDFSATKALISNVGNTPSVCRSFCEQRCQAILLTGSVFEQREGAGSDALRAVSPYGLSKGLTADVFRYYAETFGLAFGKFVIPNPFGPYEERRFTSVVAEKWINEEMVSVSHPSYVRDNVPITLLAKAYAMFAEKVFNEKNPYQQTNPSYFVETQGSFTTRFAKEMGSRLKKPCLFHLEEQTDFSEPVIRINTEPLIGREYGWNETEFWDELAEFYQNIFNYSKDSSYGSNTTKTPSPLS